MQAVAGRQTHQHFVVTGAGTGIGRAIAARLAAEGAAVSLIGRRPEPLATTADLVLSTGGTAHVSVADIRDADSIHGALAECATALGPIRGVVANAGVGGPNQPGPDDRFNDLVQTNLVGTYNTLRAAQAHLHGGPDPRHMVVIASILGRFGVPGYTGYCASKAGLFGLVRAFAMEVAADGVRVNAVAPGWVETEMAWQGIDGMAAAMGTTRDQALAEAMRAVPMGKMSQPGEIAGLVAWLVSPDGAGVTGQGLDMNNGAWM